MLLAVDTSTQWVGLALYDGVQVLGEMTWQTRNHHTVELAPAVQELLGRCGAKAGDLKALGVAIGPGSFTALRIGLALAKGIALALRIPLAGVPTLDVLAAPVPVQALPLAAVLQAGRGRLAVGMYAAHGPKWRAQGEPQVMSAEALAQQITEPTLVCGELAPNERALLEKKCKLALVLSPAHSLRRPSFLAELAWNRWKAGLADDAVALSPIYLRAPDIPADEPVSAPAASGTQGARA